MKLVLSTQPSPSNNKPPIIPSETIKSKPNNTSIPAIKYG